MKVTYNWLKDFVDIKIPAKALADKLTMAGLEVVSLEEKSGDFVFEIEITSNRPDWLSILGVAREVAAITGAKLRIPSLPSSRRPGRHNLKRSKNGLKIEIKDKQDCPLYTARIINNVKVGPAPDWIRQRLELIGCRSVNNVVDITNYVLFELGEPLHAFDLDKLNPEKIIVRRAKPQEKILTIDGEENNLCGDVLVIADKDKIVAAAGVMGGKDTEVSQDTKNILLEAASFNPVLVRRSRQALGKNSESSYRFERGVDLDMVSKASLRAEELLKEYCGSREFSFIASGASKPREMKISLDPGYISEILGIKLGASKVKQILTGLGFKVSQRSKGILNIGVPSFRQDVKIQVDLVEEVARVFGYERIPASIPAVKPCITVSSRRDFIPVIKNILTGLGLNEAVTYSLIDREGLNNLGLSAGINPIEIMNPLSREQEILSPTLILGLGRAVSFNINQRQDYVAIFEIANIFKGGKEPQEELALGVALSGVKSFFAGKGLFKDEVSLLNLKGILEKIFISSGVTGYEFISRGEASADVYINKEKIGSMWKLGRGALSSLEIKNRDVFMFEVSLDKFLAFARPDKTFAPVPKYPGISRDISFILKENISVKDILVLLKEKGRPLLREIKVADYYKGSQIPPGHKGFTLACLYSSDERTLTEKEVQPVHDLLCETLARDFEARMR